MEKSKNLGIIIADGMPPPNKLKKALTAKEGEEPDMDDYDDEDGGQVAFNQMMGAMDKGDKAAAYDAFMDAVRICSAKAKEESPAESEA